MLCLNPLCNSPKKFNQKYLLYIANWHISKAIFSLICIKWSASSKIFDKKQYVSLKGEILWMLRFMMRLILQTLYLENKSNLFLYSDIKSRPRGDTKVYKMGNVKKGNEAIKRGGNFWKGKTFYVILSKLRLYKKYQYFPNSEICIKVFIKYVHRWANHNYKGW